MAQLMMDTTDVDAIRQVLGRYAEGARSGRSADLKDIFAPEATISGYVGPDLFAGPIQMFFEWHDENGAAADLHMDIVSIDVQDTIATVRVELENWTGHRFTDMFTLLKMGGEWKITSKVFHMHA